MTKEKIIVELLELIEEWESLDKGTLIEELLPLVNKKELEQILKRQQN